MQGDDTSSDIMTIIGIILCTCVFFWQARVVFSKGGTAARLTDSDIAELRVQTEFKPNQLRLLYKRFKRLDKENKGFISADDMLSIPELAMNPLAARIIAVFDIQSTDSINFSNFVSVLNVFHEDTDRDEKLEFAFRIYDIDNDGFITPRELRDVMKMMAGSYLADEDLDKVVKQTIEEADKDGDGKISRAEFNKVLGHADPVSKMTIDFPEKILT
eukprot:CFRG8477T1